LEALVLLSVDPAEAPDAPVLPLTALTDPLVPGPPTEAPLLLVPVPGPPVTAPLMATMLPLVACDEPASSSFVVPASSEPIVAPLVPMPP
jgi:hypothetical protein